MRRFVSLSAVVQVLGFFGLVGGPRHARRGAISESCLPTFLVASRCSAPGFLCFLASLGLVAFGHDSASAGDHWSPPGSRHFVADLSRTVPNRPNSVYLVEIKPGETRDHQTVLQRDDGSTRLVRIEADQATTCPIPALSPLGGLLLMLALITASALHFRRRSVMLLILLLMALTLHTSDARALCGECTGTRACRTVLGGCVQEPGSGCIGQATRCGPDNVNHTVCELGFVKTSCNADDGQPSPCSGEEDLGNQCNVPLGECPPFPTFAPNGNPCPHKNCVTVP